MKKIILILLTVVLVSYVWASDVEMVAGDPRVKSIRQSYFTGTGNIADSASITTQGTDIWEIISYSLHLSAAGGANSLTVTINNGLGAAYDVIILTQDMTSVTDLIQLYSLGEFVLQNTDTLDFAWTNASGRTYGLVIRYRMK